MDFYSRIIVILKIYYFTRQKNQMENQQIVLGYWGTAGLAQPLRYILALSGANWKDEVYLERERWFNHDKQSLKIPFANLPYLINRQFKLSQSSAIIFYLPKCLGLSELLGKTLQDEAKVNQYLALIGDINTSYFEPLKDQKWQVKKTQIYANLQQKLEEFQKDVKDNFCLGYLTIADLRLSDVIYAISQLFPQQSKDIKKLKKIASNVYNIPQIKEYLKRGVINLFPSFIYSKLQIDVENVKQWELC